MNRRRFLHLGAVAGLSVAGCTGSDAPGGDDGNGENTDGESGDGSDGSSDEPRRPTDEEFDVIRTFAADGIFALEWTRRVLVAVADGEGEIEDLETARGDLETVLDEDRDDLPPADEVETWEFSLTRDGESWDVDGEELATVLADLEAVSTDALAVVTDLIDALNDDEVPETLADDIESLVEDIDGVVADTRSILFNE